MCFLKLFYRGISGLNTNHENSTEFRTNPENKTMGGNINERHVRLLMPNGFTNNFQQSVQFIF